MRALLDTSSLLAALVEAHPWHERALAWLERAKSGEIELVVCAHSLAELYSNLTGRSKPRISPGQARRLIQDNVEGLARIVSLSASDYAAVLRDMADLGLAGGIVYDALVAKAAEKAGAERLVTFNAEHFRRVWPEGADVICAP